MIRSLPRRSAPPAFYKKSRRKRYGTCHDWAPEKICATKLFGKRRNSGMSALPTMERLSLAMPRKRFAQQRFCVERRRSGASAPPAFYKKSRRKRYGTCKKRGPRGKFAPQTFSGERRNSGMSALPTFFKNKKVGTSDMELVPTMERLMGVEPTCQAWEACILPMNYSRIFF